MPYMHALYVCLTYVFVHQPDNWHGRMQPCNNIKSFIRQPVPVAKSKLQGVKVGEIDICVLVRLCDIIGDVPRAVPKSAACKGASSSQCKPKASSGVY